MRIMKKISVLLYPVLAICLLTISCGPTLQVTSDYDHSANFSNYHTFKIVKLEQKVQAISQLNQNRIIDAVRNQMKAKGFTETEEADLLVNIVTILKDEKQVTANTYGYGGGYRPYAWGGGYSSTTVNVENYKNGSLIVEVADAKTKNLLWEGIGNQDIDQPSSNPDQSIQTAVKSIMASFPPGMAKKK
jgi:hypothetical protein